MTQKSAVLIYFVVEALNLTIAPILMLRLSVPSCYYSGAVFFSALQTQFNQRRLYHSRDII